MFAPISAIFSLLFLAPTLPNGIRLVELPSEGNNVQIVAGYTSGGLTGLAATAAAKSLLMDAHAVGAEVELIDDQDRTAFRITAPKWALPMLLDRLPPLLGDVGAAPTSPVASGFKAKVEEEIRNALLGPDIPPANYATDNAFLLISAPIPNSLREALAAIPRRGSATQSGDAINRLPAERTLRFKADLAEGAVVFASPIPGAYYKQWYLVLLLDRLIRRIVPLKLTATFPLTVRPYYYRLELPVPSGQFPEPVEENLLQELQRLQFAPASARDLSAAREDALAYLNSSRVREWFASYDMMERREEGIQWVQSMSADDMRVAARDLLIMNRVIATWAPRPRQAAVSSEPLAASASNERAAKSAANDERVNVPSAPGNVLTTFPAHTDPAVATSLPERLPSGVSLVASSANAVFVSSGAMTRFSRELTSEDLRPFQQYRAERILVLAPASSLDRARQLWSGFKGAASGETGVSRGKVSNGDLPALFILKTILDLRIIEAGWWQDVSLRIDAGLGTDLQIKASDERHAQILSWIKNIAGTSLPEAYYTWVREVAVHRFGSVVADVQALTWERDPQGVVQSPATVPLMHVQDVARIYF